MGCSIRSAAALVVLGACSAPPEPVASTPPLAVASAAEPVQDASFAEPVDAADAGPPYDVEADRTRRLHAAEEDLGEHAAAIKVTSPFVLAGPNRAAIAGSEAFIEAVLGAYRNERYGTSPERAISIYVFPAASAYHAYCRRVYGGKDCISHFGFYEPDERKIIMQGGAGGTLSHELAHPFFEADFPSGPIWLNEGIASVFEQPVLYPKGQIHGGKNWRLPRLLQALNATKEKDEARLEALFGMPDATFRNDQESLHYAIARYACQWLDDHGWLWHFYKAYRDDFVNDPSGSAAFTTVVGKKPADATREWHRWLRAL